MENGDLLLAHICVLAELVRLKPDTFELKSDVIVPFLVTKVLIASHSQMVAIHRGLKQKMEDLLSILFINSI